MLLLLNVAESDMDRLLCGRLWSEHSIIYKYNVGDCSYIAHTHNWQQGEKLQFISNCCFIVSSFFFAREIDI